eukprot:1002810-Ditylum_brightwellii.AAC.1
MAMKRISGEITMRGDGRVGPAFSMLHNAYSHVTLSILKIFPTRVASGVNTNKGHASREMEKMQLPTAHNWDNLVEPKKLLCLPNSAQHFHKSMQEI